MTLCAWLRAGVAGIAVSLWACRNGTAPGPTDLEFRPSSQDVFPGQSETLFVYVGYTLVAPRTARWTSTDTSVVTVTGDGVIDARRVGEAWVRVSVGEASGSIRVRVYAAPEGAIAFAGFRSFEDPTFGLWYMRADGSGLRELFRAQPGGGVGNPSFSPDGCSLVAQVQQPNASASKLWRFDVGGIGAYRMIGGSGIQAAPVWSPLGDKIVFSGLTLTGFELFSVRPDFSELTQLTTVGAAVAMASAFFPSGEDVAFERVFEDGGRLTSDIYALSLATSELRPLVTRQLLDDQEPSVSPDGRDIAFSGVDSIGPFGGVNHAVRIARPDGSISVITPPLRVEISARDPDGTAASAVSPSFAPDGQWLALDWNRDQRLVAVRTDARGNEQEDVNTIGEIYAARSDGSAHVRLTHFALAGQPSWGARCPTP